MIKFGVALNIAAETERGDAEVVREHMALGDLIEPLGFDALFVLEHHFTGYILSPAPLQMLAYYAGRTSRIALGTAVVVLPWHDPVRVAEQIALLDIMCNGRCLFAFGRGRSNLEYKGFRIPISEGRPRFAEAISIVVGLLDNEVFEYQGEFYQIPALSIRPRPVSRPHERFYGPAMGKDSADMLAKLGFGMLLATQKSWTSLSADVAYFNKVAAAAGYRPRGPIVFASVSVAESRQHARERALEFLGRERVMSDIHYHPSEGHQPPIDQPPDDQATAAYMNLQLVGTPDDCIQQVEELASITSLEYLVLEFSYGGMPYCEAEANMKMFASDIVTAFKQGSAGPS